jgi:hypothetical protein
VSRVTPNAKASGSPSPAENDLETLEELSDDAIVAHQQGAHMPQPRAQITEEARSVVISDHPKAPPGAGSEPPRSQERRSVRRTERTEKTVVIRSRRQIEELRRAVAQYGRRATKGQNRGVLLWVVVGLAAFLGGGLVALFATPSKPPVAPAASAPLPSEAPPPSAAQADSAEPPSVSIDELPLEGSRKRKR